MRVNNDGNVLDLVLVNNMDIIFDYNIRSVLRSVSDHTQVTVSTKYKALAEEAIPVTPKCPQFDTFTTMKSHGTKEIDIYLCCRGSMNFEERHLIKCCNHSTVSASTLPRLMCRSMLPGSEKI